MLFGGPAANTVTLVAAVITMTTISPLVTVIALVAAIPLIPLLRRAGGKVHACARKQAQANRDVTAYLAERLTVGGALLRIIFGHLDNDFDGIRQRMDRYYDATIARNMIFARSSLVLGVFSTVGIGIGYLVSGWGRITGSLSVGSIVALVGLVGQASHRSPHSRPAESTSAADWWPSSACTTCWIFRRR